MNAALLLVAQRADEVRTALARTDAERIAAAEYHAQLSSQADVLRTDRGPHEFPVVARRAVRHTHPDTGGTAEAFDRVQRAIAVLRPGGDRP